MSYTGDAIGTIKAGSVCSTCGPAIEASDNCSEYGPEWNYNTYGSCGECQFNCVSFGALGNACTVGTYARCQKFQHTGSPTQCCLNQVPTGYPNVTCDPSYTPLSPGCSSIVQNYCSSGDKIFTDPICQSWASQPQNTQTAFTMQQQYCTVDKISGDQNCRNWVASAPAQGKIDSLMITNYCQTHPTDSLCSCVMSEIPCPNKFDTNCIQKGGYKSADMMNVQCPNVLNCTQFLSLSPGAQAIATNVQQNCASSSTPTSVTPTTTFWSNYKIVILIIILILIIIIALLIIYRKQIFEDNPTNE